MDLFSYLGDVGVNAATQYANGTALTDALYGVRYYMDIKEYTQEEVENNPQKCTLHAIQNVLISQNIIQMQSMKMVVTSFMKIRTFSQLLSELTHLFKTLSLVSIIL